MKIAIYDIVHLDWVIPLAELLLNSPHQISFFIHKNMKEDIETSLAPNIYNRYEWIFLEDEHIFSRYKILSNQTNNQRYDIFWLNTADSKHLAFALLRFKYRKLRLLINVHELNSFFRSRWSLNIKRSLKHISKKILAKAADAYLINAEKMNRYVTDNNLTTKPCYTFAPVYYKETYKKNISNDIFTVIIPGLVDERRRDYQAALEAWKIFLNKKNPLIEARLILAGRITQYIRHIPNLYKNDEELKKTVNTYTEDIDELTFQNLIANASVILSPQILETSVSDGITETYGITKNSGNSYDTIRYAKPFIVPLQLNIPKELDSYAIRYSSPGGLADILLTLCHDKEEYNRFCQKAQESSGKFSYKTVQEKLENIIKSISTPE